MTLNEIRRQYDAVASRYEALFAERQSKKIRRLRQHLPLIQLPKRMIATKKVKKEGKH